MLAFEIADGGRDEVLRFFDALRLVEPVTTLGDVYTEVLNPVMASHRSWSPAQLRRVGITPGLMRISAGIEDADDLIADLSQALAQIAAPSPPPRRAARRFSTLRLPRCWCIPGCHPERKRR